MVRHQLVVWTLVLALALACATTAGLAAEPHDDAELQLWIDEDGDIVVLYQQLEMTPEQYEQYAAAAIERGHESVAETMAADGVEHDDLFGSLGSAWDEQTDQGYVLHMAFTDVNTSLLEGLEADRDGDELQFSMPREAGGTTTVALHVPGAIVESTATETTDGTAVWEPGNDADAFALTVDLATAVEWSGEPPAVPDDAVTIDDLEIDDDQQADDELVPGDDDSDHTVGDGIADDEADDDAMPGLGAPVALAAVLLTALLVRRR